MRARTLALFVVEGEGTGMRRSGIEVAKRMMSINRDFEDSVTVRGAIRSYWVSDRGNGR